MKYILRIVFLILVSFLNFNVIFSNSDGEGNSSSESKLEWVENDPDKVIDKVKGEVGSDVQDTALNDVEGQGIAGTLEGLSNSLSPYIDLAVFIGLSLAVILIIYNGVYLIVLSQNDSAFGEVKSRLAYLSIGVLILLGFYLILELIMSLIGEIF